VSTPPKAALAKAATRAVNRAEIVDANFLQFLDAWSEPVRTGSLDAPVRDGFPLTGRDALQIFEAQILSRHLDLEARAMRARGEGYYTIGSSGHEGNAVVGFLTRTTDPAFLHYRSGGFMMARGLQTEGCDPVYDTALSLAASSDDPISGGRHKVWGSKPGWVLPQTSTIASHLSKAVGAAIGLEQAKRLKRELPVPADSIVVCSFGDASANHAAALAAFNTAEWTAYQKLPVPILFVCEDNGIGISVRTPSGWIAHAFSNRLGMSYVQANGLDIAETHEAAGVAIEHCRSRRAPVFLHLTLQRLLAHAGTDAETEYRSLAEIEASEAADPLRKSAEILIRAGVATPATCARVTRPRASAPAARLPLRPSGPSSRAPPRSCGRSRPTRPRPCSAKRAARTTARRASRSSAVKRACRSAHRRDTSRCRSIARCMTSWRNIRRCSSSARTWRRRAACTRSRPASRRPSRAHGSSTRC
jgi:2-oxoisovalerate dehydrogenase E1 component